MTSVNAGLTGRRWWRWIAAPVIATLSAIFGAVSPAPGQSQDDAQVPGDGRPVVVARPSWDTGWFQAEVVSQLLVELGYLIDGPTTYGNDDFYQAVQDGSVDLWVNGWFPTHNSYLSDDDESEARPIGYSVKGGALQGYMADLATIEEANITSLADLADPAIAARFDADGDGKADLLGCNAEWACQQIVDHHLDVYGLADTVEQVSTDYGPLMNGAVQRLNDGEPVLYFSFTPNWVNGVMVPGREVAWIPVPFASYPDGFTTPVEDATVVDVAGCLGDPCNMGFEPNDIRAVAGVELLEAEPAIASLLEDFTISLGDISEQNSRMFRGEDAELDIERHATRWITDNGETVDRWLESAVDAHLAAGGQLAPRPQLSNVDQVAVGSLRVATRPAPPFVVYDDGTYGGFTIELLQLIAGEIGADLQIYGVNTNAKLIDEVARGEAAVGAGAIAVTSQREQRIDFSQSYFSSGLEIMVPRQSSRFLGGLLGTLLSRDVLLVVATLLLFLVAAAHVIWLAERRTNPDFPTAYLAGVWEAFWWAAVTATTVGYGDKTPKGVIGRLFGLFWMFVGLFLLAYFTAGIASAVALDRVEGSITGFDDLRTHQVGVVTDSLADEYLALQGIRTTEFVTAEDAYGALADGTIEAVVHDAAILKHYAVGPAGNDFQLVGSLFAERGLSYAVSTDGEIGEAIDRGLIAVIESGDYDELHDRWFGTER